METLSSSLAATIAVSERFGLPLIDLHAYDLARIPIDFIDEKFMRHHRMVVLHRRGERLDVAIAAPASLAALNELKFKTGLNTQPILVEENKLTQLIEKLLLHHTSSALSALEAHLEESEHTIGTSNLTDDDDAPIVRFVNKILLDAIHNNVSDIHFEPFETSYRIRYRRDGVLYETARPAQALSPRISARLKVIAQLDIAERRLPQDGHFKMAVSPERSLDFRINTCPTISGEKVVIRILDPASAHLGIAQLGLEEKQQQLFLDHIQKPQGMVLVTGPTGSGKTVSLYTALDVLNTEAVNISTIEDPVEINITGINQVHVNLKAGLGFASALRVFLRQDPDIIMVGEIRDLETAEIAVKASLTGHMVLSTLHTNSAAETLTRLLNMGIPAFNVATSVSLIVAQRLARRLCNECKHIIHIPEKSLLEMGFSNDELCNGFTLFGPHNAGCQHCHFGYTGRIGLYEMLPVSSSIAEVIMSGGNSLDILRVALKEGLQTLRRSGLNRVCEGLTSIEEINRIT
jgi:type IV pilus assembly protein PilB